jgi:peroxin-10
MYYATTTAAGLQTLGEEYCDIMQLTQLPAGSSSSTQQAQGMPSAQVRVLLTLLQSLGPAVLTRLTASLDRASDEGRLQYDPTGFDDSDDTQHGSSHGLAYQQQDLQQQDLQQASSSTQRSMRQLLQQVQSSLQQVQQQLAPHWPSIKSWLVFAARVHLAVFYLHGNYYEWSKRLLGVRYTSISPSKEQRASYRFLGYLLVAQLVITGAMQARSQLASAQEAVGSGGSSTEQSQGTAGSHAASKHAVLLPDPFPQPAAGNKPAEASRSGLGASTPASTGSLGGSRQCPLCLSVRSHPTCTPCGHVFCWQCIAQWCLEKPECPLCRTNVVSSQLVCLYHSDL